MRNRINALYAANWICPRCHEKVVSTFQRNLEVLVCDHKQRSCPRLGERLLTPQDLKFLKELKVSWPDAEVRHSAV